mmetsp:Transcript_4499/g.7591  ORF Transcript_4499/g.7591 Transcript_4499/m.7591 type:complete len:203 (+) Transcript_4499:579-1187(+)
MLLFMVTTRASQGSRWMMRCIQAQTLCCASMSRAQRPSSGSYLMPLPFSWQQRRSPFWCSAWQLARRRPWNSWQCVLQQHVRKWRASTSLTTWWSMAAAHWRPVWLRYRPSSMQKRRRQRIGRGTQRLSHFSRSACARGVGPAFFLSIVFFQIILYAGLKSQLSRQVISFFYAAGRLLFAAGSSQCPAAQHPGERCYSGKPS